VIESKFELLHCTEVLKTLFAAQQLHGDASAWWANYAATCPTDYQVSWTEFRSAFRTHNILVGVMGKKHQEFRDVKQGGQSVHDYSKLFNHLAQYVLDQVDTDDKKKDRFMIGLSTKLQKCMALNIGGSFPEFVSNIIIADEAICTHKEAKKRKVVVVLSGCAPPRYRTVYHHGPTYPPHQQQQWVSRPPQRQHQQAASRALPPPPPVPASATNHRNDLRSYLLQLWPLGPLRVRVPRTQEKHHSGPRHPSMTWSTEGGCCQDRPCQLLHYGRHF
jgi:hypothetical protein